jgi:cytochrome P450
MWTILGTIFALRFLAAWFYRLYLHPLRKYPGPVLNKLSSIPQLLYNINCRDTYTRYDLHQQYGPVVRVAPNELCFSDAASIKDIYGQSSDPCLKDPNFYDGLIVTGERGLFTIIDKHEHARTKRLLSHPFSLQGVLRFESEMAKHIQKFVHIIASADQPVDVHDPAHNLFLDTSSLLSLGRSFNLLSGEQNQGAHDIETYFNIAPLFGRFRFARYLPFGPFRAAWKARPRMIAFCQSCIDDFRQRLKNGTAQHGLLKGMIEAKDEETGKVLSDAELIDNMIIFIIAGSGTTATALLYVLYEMGRRPNMQKKLVQEIRDAFPEPGGFPDYDTASKLVRIHAISDILYV